MSSAQRVFVTQQAFSLVKETEANVEPSFASCRQPNANK